MTIAHGGRAARPVLCGCRHLSFMLATPALEHVDAATALMAAFARRTGIGAVGPGRRYLWTDAFAVCNYLSLARSTGSSLHEGTARRLIGLVHCSLGRHRADDERRGWLSGLDDLEGEEHPTRGGLRIGKPLPERRADEPFDERREWDRDGQYFHYLTKWMHALDQAARVGACPLYNLWARELAQRAYAGFVVRPEGGARPRMAWKMSIDLTRPLVPSMGQHDPLDGLVTCAQLRATARALGDAAQVPTLDVELAGLRSMSVPRDWATLDPLGLGGILVDAARVAQLPELAAEPSLLGTLLELARDGLHGWLLSHELRRSPERRLAFRELGLAIGLRAVERIAAEADRLDSNGREALRWLGEARGLGAALEAYWLDPGHRQSNAWRGHEDINDVMLASALLPDGIISLRAGGVSSG
jgi:hypothetical protein